jgi:hypothetical protein
MRGAQEGFKLRYFNPRLANGAGGEFPAANETFRTIAHLAQ